MIRVGLITMHNVCNIGAMLQAYALQVSIEKLGADCEIINYIPDLRRGIRQYWPKGQGISFIRSTASNIKWLPQRILWQKPYCEFKKNYLKVSDKVFYDDKEIYTYNFDYNVFVTGSDQVWNPGSTDGFNSNYFLDFVKNKKKVSYAASISVDSLSLEDKRIVQQYLSDFTAISIRETHAINLLNEFTKQDIELVLDPTLLLDSIEWKEVSKESKIEINCKYLLIYMLGSDSRVIELAKFIAREKNLKILQFGWNIKKKKFVDIDFSFMSPIDFVKIIGDAEYVVTNSFHGTAFAINNRIDFVAIPSSYNNPRFVSLLELFGITERLYQGESSYSEYLNKINYDIVDIKLSKLRVSSINYIKLNILDWLE